MAQDWVISLDEEEAGITAAGKGPCWDGYKQVGMKKGKDGKMVPNCVPVDASDSSDFSDESYSGFAGKKARTISQTPAPKKDNIKGSGKNAKGSASGSKKVVFSKSTEESLKKKVQEHNKKASAGRKATLGMLKAVYRRGAGAFSTSHRPGMTRNQWAMGRVNAYLRLLSSGRPKNSSYKTDNDLLPSAHPKSTKGVTASGEKFDYENELSVEILDKDSYEYPEDAIIAMAEYSGFGYEAETAIRASWLRGVRNGDDPFKRAALLASLGHESLDADLLPAIEEE